MPLCMTVSWIYTVALAVQAIVYEKEQRLKEVMKMMGLSNAVHWVAWFITSLAVMSITVSLLVVILKVNTFLFLFNGGIVAEWLGRWNSCYRSCAHGQSLLCLQLRADEANGSIQWKMTL